MLERLKDLKVILIILLVISWLVGGFVIYQQGNTKKQALAGKEAEIQELETSLAQIGELVPAYTVRTNVPSGKKITEEDLELIEVPVSMATNLISDIEELEGRYYKLGMTAGTVLTVDSVYEEELTDDLRLFDVVTHTNPIGLRPGSYVDIRIQMPLGDDYIAIPHRKVLEINDGILKVAVNEGDIHTYNSMLVDSLIYPGTQIYAVEYMEGGVQKAAEGYYPASKNIIAIAQKDPNLLKALKEDMLARRNILETGLDAAGMTAKTEEEIKRLNETLKNGREQIIQNINKSAETVSNERAEFERQQAEMEGLE